MVFFHCLRPGCRLRGNFDGLNSLLLKGTLVALSVNTRPRAHFKALGFECQRLFDLELIVGMIDQLEALQDHTEYQRCFLHRKLAANTGTLPIPERLVSIGWSSLFNLGSEMIRVEFLGILAPYAFISMKHRYQDRQILTMFADAIFATNDGFFFIGIHCEHRSRRPQPERLLENLRHIFQACDLSKCWWYRGIWAKHTINFLICFR